MGCVADCSGSFVANVRLELVSVVAVPVVHHLVAVVAFVATFVVLSFVAVVKQYLIRIRMK